MKIFLFFLCLPIFAATYYVDFTAGSDATAGTSTGAAWEHCPGDSAATGTPASTTLAAGDTVIFKGGVQYTGQITVASSGSSGSPITYDGNSAGNWGSGRAILDGGSVINAIGFNITSHNYITINNFEIQHYGGYTDMSAYDCNTNLLPDRPGTGIFIKQANHITVENSYLHEIGIWQNVAPVSGGSEIDGYGIRVDSGTYITISGNELTKMSYGIYLDPYNSSPLAITNVTISNNNLHNYMRWLITLVPSADSATLQDIDIHGNTIHDYSEYDSGAGNTFCTANFPHTDGIMLFVAGIQPSGVKQGVVLGTPTHPIKIYSNWFYQNNTNAAGTASIFLTVWGGTVYVYDNIFENSHSAHNGGYSPIYIQDGLRAADNDPVMDYHILNNTFFDNVWHIYLRSITAGFELDRPGYVIDIQNNIFFFPTTIGSYSLIESQSGTTTDGLNHSAPTTLNNNLYYMQGQAQSSTHIYEVWTCTALPCTGTDKHLADYSYNTLQSSLGFEPNGKYGDPLLVNTSYGLGVNSSLNDLRLSPNSPARNAGANLSSIFTTDAAGNARPSSGAWDSGAYQYAPPVTGSVMFGTFRGTAK